MVVSLHSILVKQYCSKVSTIATYYRITAKRVPHWVCENQFKEWSDDDGRVAWRGTIKKKLKKIKYNKMRLSGEKGTKQETFSSTYNLGFIPKVILIVIKHQL